MSPIGPTGAGGAVTAAAIQATFTAAGQVYQGTGNGTGALVLPPGYELRYDQITAPVTVASTTEATGTTIISATAFVFDGTAVYAEFFAPRAIAGASGVVTISLFESTTQITRLAEVGGTSGVQAPVFARYKFTPTAATHTYTVTAFSPSSASVQAGSGGTAGDPPAYIRFVKA